MILPLDQTQEHALQQRLVALSSKMLCKLHPALLWGKLLVDNGLNNTKFLIVADSNHKNYSSNQK